jgi:hypothetical protein
VAAPKRNQKFAHDVAGVKREKPSGKKERAGLEKMTRYKKSGEVKK